MQHNTIEGKEIMGTTNSDQVMVGMTDKRGNRWMGKGSARAYPGAIPVGEVERKLFNWKAISVPSGSFVPCDVADANFIGEDGKTYRATIVPGKQSIVHSGTGQEIGRHGKSHRVHDYSEWLIERLSNIIQDRLVIVLAMLLKGGARAAIQITLDETMHDPSTGREFWPYLIARSSVDGAWKTTFDVGQHQLDCDNMMPAWDRAAKAAGRTIGFKHTAHSLNADVIGGVRTALDILERSAEDALAASKLLTSVKLTRSQWVKVLDIILPPGVDDVDSKHLITKRDNAREALDLVYRGEGEVGAMSGPFAGTVFGAVQAWDTHTRWNGHVRGGMSRIERVVDRTLNGDIGKGNAAVLQACADVTGRSDILQLV